MEALSAWFPQLEAIPRSDFREATFSEQTRNLALMLAMSDYYWDNGRDVKLMKPKLAHEVRETADRGAPHGPRGPVGRTSFMNIRIENCPAR